MPYKDPEKRKEAARKYSKTPHGQAKRAAYVADNREHLKTYIREYWNSYQHTEKQQEYRKLRRQTHFSHQLWLRTKSRCSKDGIEFNLEECDINPPELCPVLGIPLDRRNREHTPSLDRLDPTVGYTKSNVRVISMRANRIKSDATLSELEQLYAYVKRELAQPLD